MCNSSFAKFFGHILYGPLKQTQLLDPSALANMCNKLLKILGIQK